MSYGKHTTKSGWQSNRHWAVCDVCGDDYRQDELKLRWDGAKVCKFDYEPRHTLDIIHSKPDNTAAVGVTRTEPEDNYTLVVYCYTKSAVPAYAVPGCIIPGDLSLIELDSF